METQIVSPTEKAKRGTSKVHVRMTVNGEVCDVLVEPGETLLEVLRDYLRLMGTKRGCDQGECGICAVLVDGRPVLSCITLAVMCDGHHVTTVEGIEKEYMEKIEKAFMEAGAVQCGFCTAGFVIMAYHLLKNQRKNIDIKEEITGIMCRCTGYLSILRAFEILLKNEQR